MGVLKTIGYIARVDGEDIIPLYNLSDYSISISASYEIIPFLNSSLPLVVYSNTEPRQLSLNMIVYARRNAREEVLEFRRRLERLTLPAMETEFLVLPPPPVIVRIGRSQRYICVVESVDTSAPQILMKGGEVMYEEISLSLREVRR